MSDTVIVKNFSELHEALVQYRVAKVWVFRGHGSAHWRLVPKYGRDQYRWADDVTVFESWKRRAVAFVDNFPQSDWDWLAIAQHHGLATSLLDWTTNPLSAAFFAAREAPDEDGVIYASRLSEEVDVAQSPFEDIGVAIFRPRGIVPRIVHQGGLFTIHGEPSVPLVSVSSEVDGLHRIMIPAKQKPQILSDLSFYGINSASLFPDLDGLASFMNWTIEKREFWKTKAARGRTKPPKRLPFG